MAEPIKLNIATGRQEFEFNGVKVAFNPTDAKFAGKLFKAYKEIQEIDEKREKSVSDPTSDPLELLDELEEVDTHIREEIDSIFGFEFCEAIFPKEDGFIFAIANGFPVWMNILETIMDVMDQKMLEEQNLSKERIKKYTAKYKKK